MNTVKIKVSEIKKGDRVELEDLTIATVKDVSHGFFNNSHSKLITYTNGLWSCLLNHVLITVYRNN